MRLIAGLLAATAAVAPTPPAPDRVGRVTAALRQSPVFVDPDVSYLLDARDRTALDRQIAGAGVPIYLVVAPLRSEDESAGDADYFGYLLHRRLGRNGVYLIADQDGGLDWMSYQVPRDDTLNYEQAVNDKPLPAKLHDIIDAFAHAPAAKPSDPPAPRTPEPAPGHEKSTVAGLTGQFAKAFFPSLAISGALLALVWSVGSRVVRATRGSATRLRPRRLRRTAWRELVRLARAIGAAGEDNPGYPRAMADYDAAKLLWDEQKDPGSRFGVVVLALDGQDALRAETAEPEPRCVINPLHGTAARRVRTHLDGLSRTRQPMCEDCARASTLRPLTLVIDGRERPYYQAPGLWERIGGRTGDLSGRVLEYLGVE